MSSKLGAIQTCFTYGMGRWQEVRGISGKELISITLTLLVMEVQRISIFLVMKAMEVMFKSPISSISVSMLIASKPNGAGVSRNQNKERTHQN